MEDIQKIINERTARCVKSKRGVDLLDKRVTKKIDTERILQLSSTIFDCYLRVLKQIARKKFIKWIKEDADKVTEEAEEAGRKLIRFYTRIGEPADVFQVLTYVSSIFETMSETLDNEGLLDQKLASRLLFPVALEGTRNLISLNALSPLIYIISMGDSILGKDMHWSTSTLALILEELMVKKKAVKLGISIVKDDTYYSILNKIKEEMKKSGTRMSRDFKIADAHRRIRNDVLHEGWNPTEEETYDIIGHVKSLESFLELKPSKK